MGHESGWFSLGAGRLKGYPWRFVLLFDYSYTNDGGKATGVGQGGNALFLGSIEGGYLVLDYEFLRFAQDDTLQ